MRERGSIMERIAKLVIPLRMSKAHLLTLLRRQMLGDRNEKQDSTNGGATRAAIVFSCVRDSVVPDIDAIGGCSDAKRN